MGSYAWLMLIAGEPAEVETPAVVTKRFASIGTTQERIVITGASQQRKRVQGTTQERLNMVANSG